MLRSWIVVGLLYIVARPLRSPSPDGGGRLYAADRAALVVVGIARIVAPSARPRATRRFGRFGLIAVLLGGMIVASWPASSLFVLGTFLGIDLLFYGMSWIAFGMRLKRRKPARAV